MPLDKRTHDLHSQQRKRAWICSSLWNLLKPLNLTPSLQETEDSGTYWMHHKDAISKIITVENSVGQWFSMCGPRPTTPTSPGNLLEKQILKPHSDLPIQTFLKWGPAIRIVTSAPDDSDAGLCLRTTAIIKCPRLFSRSERKREREKRSYRLNEIHQDFLNEWN